MKPYLNVNEWVVGDELPPHTFDSVTKVQLVRYAGASGDFNPLHTDDSTARSAGMDGVIAQGPLIMGCIGQTIAKWFPVRNLKKFSVRFKGMTFPGESITVKATLMERTDQEVVFDVMAVNQKEQVKIKGQFILSV